MKNNNITSLILLVLGLFICHGSLLAKENTIYIYNDEGVSQYLLKHLLSTLHDLCNKDYQVKTIDAHELIHTAWLDDAALFIMPGGADLFYAAKLNGAGNQILKNYVNNGGSYWGICAGAYYSCQSIEFDLGGELEVTGQRELSFFKGKAIGPVFAPYVYDSEKGARAAVVKFRNGSEQTFYCNGGPYFSDIENDSDAQLVASYQAFEDNRPAIIFLETTSERHGPVLLTGVHCEYNPYLFGEIDPYHAKIHPALKTSNDQRLAFIRELLTLLNLSTS